MRVKSRRRQQPAPVDWNFACDNKPKAPRKRRAILKRAIRDMDDEAISACYYFVTHQMKESLVRADLAELAVRRYTDQVRAARKSRKAVRP
jgi:hypothetical protein